MLQPALARPNGHADEDTSPSYGDFIRATRDAVDQALPIARGRGLRAETIHAELLGYERFLITTAKHVETLLTLANAAPETHWQFSVRFNRRARPLSSP